MPIEGFPTTRMRVLQVVPFKIMEEKNPS